LTQRATPWVIGAAACVFALALTLGASRSVSAQPAAGQVISGLDIGGPDDCVTIRVSFSFPVRYIEHFPASFGDDLRVRLMPIVVGDADRESVAMRESVRPASFDDRVPLQEATYDGDASNGPLLTFDFSRPVTFHVEQGDDFRSLLVVLPGPPSGRPCPRPKKDP
jgi:hypothetical protein